MNCKLQFSDIEQWNNILNVVGLLRKTIKSIPKFISPCTRRHDCQRGEAPFFGGVFLYHGQSQRRRSIAVPIVAAWKERALVSRHVRRVCLPSIATPSAKGNIGQSTKKYAKDVQPRDEKRRCSRIHRLRKTAPFASYQCRRKPFPVFRFHPQLDCLFQSRTL
jgi:hypothetical protein